MIKKPNETIKLWTRQNKNILNDLEKNGVYKVKEEYISNKMDTIFNFYIERYEWYTKRASKVVPMPEGALYPIWLSTTSDIMLQLTEDTVILELELDKNKVVFTDMNKWGYVINYFYLPLDLEDEAKHNKELKKLAIGDETALIMGDKGNFYPLLKNKVIKSWDRLFEPPKEITAEVQATLWEIKKEWIRNIIK
ncbi:MAG: DUF3841 domain-containing protein [Lachnospirales bacterium]